MQDIHQYLSDEKVSEVMDAFEELLKPRRSAKLSICFSGAALTALAIFVCFQSTCLFGILLFLCLSPIFIFAVGAFSIGSALKRMIHNIHTIFCATVNISMAVYNDQKAQNRDSVDIKQVMSYSFENIMLPVLRTVAKTVTKRKMRGRIILKCMEMILKAGAKDFYVILRDQIACNKNSDNTQPDSQVVSMGMADKVDKAALKAVNGVVVLSRVLGILFVMMGVVLTSVLLIVHAVVK